MVKLLEGGRVLGADPARVGLLPNLEQLTVLYPAHSRGQGQGQGQGQDQSQGQAQHQG